MTSAMQEKIAPMVNDVKQCLNNKAYYAALTLSLTLPDLCSTLEYPEIKEKSKVRYKKWLEEYFFDIHSDYKNVMKSGDVYALRCAYLHNGSDNLENHNAREILNKFRFIHAPEGWFVHRNSIINNGVNVLQLDVREFCNEILDAVASFLYLNKEDESINKEAEKMIILEDISNGFLF